jgi:membrane glycosyltransferase
MAYLSSVWWLLLLLLWALSGQGGTAIVATPLLADWSLTPQMPQTTIAGVVVAMLVAPKLLGIIAHLRGNGLPIAGVPRFAGLVTAELLVSALLAPALMVHQVRAVLRIVRGGDGGWMPHATGRSDLRTLLRFHAVETGLGVVLLSLSLAGKISPWLLPISVSLCLTIPLAALVQMPLSAFKQRQAGEKTA